MWHRVSCRDITCPAALDPEYHGNYMIWTPTAGGTLSAEFEPLLPVEKNSALRTVYYETSVKVILAFQTPFWEKDHSERRGGHVFTDLPLQSLYYPSQKLGKNGWFVHEFSDVMMQIMVVPLNCWHWWR